MSQLPEKLTADQLTGAETIGGFQNKANSIRTRVIVELLELIKFADALRAKRGDPVAKITVGNGAPTNPAKNGELYIDAVSGDLYQGSA